ncbi:coiled-coil domain-containing protein 66 isoform X6 [Stegostoma tigrinum]|uniref:coiled-coil domain-containing protein 66 isoform X6 n=1 Tax=Stegostoma tigrinum TaxID=3053191 RepID=UPI00202B50C2|nr:coiled-coil domain-containing protein 66 isoform X6 [Stegostoma tigrinum]
MNLGDGLKLETHFFNGKPKLILAPYDASSKDIKRIKCKNRTTTHQLRSKVLQEVPSTPECNSKTERLLLKHAVPNTTVGSGKGANTKQLTVDKKTDKSKSNNETVPKNGQSGNKTTVKKLVTTKQQPTKKQKISSAVLKESLVCLTQEQLQQILASISQVNGNFNQNLQRVKHTEPDKKVKEAEAICKELKGKDNATLPKGFCCTDNEASKDNNSSQNVQATSKPLANVEQTNSMQTDKTVVVSTFNQVRDGLFRHLGERENERDQLEAKRLQWKKELDEQVALKKLLAKDNATSEVLEWNPWGRPGAGAPMRSKTEKIITIKSQATLPAASGPCADSRVISTAPTAVNTVDINIPSDHNVGKASSFSFPDLPAAIRSAFVLGGDDHNRWAMHFDSYQKKPEQQTPIYVNTSGSALEKSSESTLEKSSESSELQQFPTHAVPVISHHNSSARENISGFMGPDVLSNPQKTSFLRSMTALLDPAQIEERDLRRKKQLEHQKAIAIQVEERRRQKQLEEDQKREEEQKEELRLAKERERLRQQYEEETRAQREKEEFHNRKTNMLYETVQRAQEEAQRQKQEQRMRELVRKGHDISNLQKNEEGATSCTSSCTASGSHGCEDISEVLGQAVMEKDSPRKDRGIQTEDFELIVKVEHSAEITDHSSVTYTPDTIAECNTVPISRKSKMKPNEKIAVTEKENVLLYDDSCDQFAKTKGKNEKRPEWNTNKTSKRYIPASERYPKGLQREREEKKMRRQMELLQLLEKSVPEHRVKKKQPSKDPILGRPPSPVVPALQEKIAACLSSQPVEKQELSLLQQDDPALQSNSNSKLPADKVYSRCISPPVPALRNKPLQMERKELHSIPSVNEGEWCQRDLLSNESDNDRPPSSNFVPYVRTDEVYHLDPDAPLSRPSTNDPQYKHFNVTDYFHHQNYSSDRSRDPLLNPDLVRNRERQQAILKGLSELRQGLMQKQRELETGLTSSPAHEDEQYLATSQNV